MKDSKAGGGIGIAGVVQVVFIILKLTKLVNWKWWVVLMPTWIWIGLIAIALTVFGICKYIEDK